MNDENKRAFLRSDPADDGANNPLVAYTRGPDLSGTLEGAGGIGGLLARSDNFFRGNFLRHNYYHADGNGNITYLETSSQGLAASYRYDPFGNTISSSGTFAATNVYRFSSKECHVNSGMYYYLYRFYDPNLQRWLNRDPIGEEGFRSLMWQRSRAGLADIDLFSFARNDPVNDFDALGLGKDPNDLSIDDCFDKCEKKRKDEGIKECAKGAGGRAAGYIAGGALAVTGGLLASRGFLAPGIILVGVGGGFDTLLWYHHSKEVDKINKRLDADRVACVKQCGKDWNDPDAANNYLQTGH
jgi:RHS repeat-associated protein